MRSIKAIVVGSFFVLGSFVLTVAQPVDQPVMRIEQGRQDDGTANIISAATYPLSVQSGVALEDMSSGTTELIAAGADNENSAVANIGFVFRFNFGFYTTFGASANGLIRLGNASSTTNTNNLLNSNFNSPKIAPFWDDLCVGSGGKVHYKTVASSGVRKLIVEWTNMKTSRDGYCDGSGGGTFQLWLFDRSGIVQFVYGSGVGPTATADGGYSVGMQTNVDNSSANITTATNTVNYVFANNGQFNAIAPGTSYIFTPNMPAAPGGGSAIATESSVTLNWTDNASNETTYLVRRTTNHVDFYFIGVLGANASAFTDTELLPSSQYFYYVNALSEGAFSDDLVISASTSGVSAALSTAAGGNWSSPSTWANGVVPAATDSVTIADGATVTIDTNASAGSLTIGSGGAAAKLVFDQTAARSLTIARDLTIGSNGALSTAAGGSVTTHVLTAKGSIINNGTLDLSTNKGQAGATINFAGANSAIFGGTGPVTDIFKIKMNKASWGSVVDLTVSNFSVQGSTTDSAASSYLDPTGGTFKISGTFTGNHRTFPAGGYTIPAAAGFWLNNPNYTVTPQAGNVTANGGFRISAGTFNIGTDSAHNFDVQGPTFIMEGGKINAAGRILSATDFLKISGGTVTGCMVPASPPTCIMGFATRGVLQMPFEMSGGDIVFQNPGVYSSSFETYLPEYMTGTTIHFGNSLTSGPGTYFVAGVTMDMVIDTSSGFPQKVQSGFNEVITKNVTIQPGGRLEVVNLTFYGTSFVNNGVFKLLDDRGAVTIDHSGGTRDVTFSGTGVIEGIAGYLNILCRTLTFSENFNLTTLRMQVTEAQVINAGHITLGRNDSTENKVEMFNRASIDAPLSFNIGAGGQTVYYRNVVGTGPEIKPDRNVKVLSQTGPGSLALNGGDLTAASLQLTGGGVIVTGSSTITTQLPTGPAPNGYVDGNLRMQFTSGNVNQEYVFPVGSGGTASPARVKPVSVTGSAALKIRAIDTTLPGLNPSLSASRYWTIAEEGNMSAQLTLVPAASDINGNPADYQRYRSNGGAPVLVTDVSVDQLTGDWGLGVMTVAISGQVTTSGGMPIRNAIVTISGGGLPAPMTYTTGSLGNYIFSGLTPGQTYTVQASAKRHRFPFPGQTVTPNTDLTGVNIMANPQE